MKTNTVNIKGIKYFLFDVDGLLVDSEKVFNRCWIAGAKSEGYDLSFEQALQLRSLNSRMAQKLFEEWFNDLEAYAKTRAARKKMMAEELARTPIAAKKGIQEMLSLLNKHQIKYAVVSSSPVSRCREYLEQYGLAEKFETYVSGEMVENGKPYPDIYKLACDKLGIHPSECIAVEDSPNGLKSAHYAGCYTIMIPDLSDYTEDLSDFVDYVANSLSNITFIK